MINMLISLIMVVISQCIMYIKSSNYTTLICTILNYLNILQFFFNGTSGDALEPLLVTGPPSPHMPS